MARRTPPNLRPVSGSVGMVKCASSVAASGVDPSYSSSHPPWRKRSRMALYTPPRNRNVMPNPAAKRFASVEEATGTPSATEMLEHLVADRALVAGAAKRVVEAAESAGDQASADLGTDGSTFMRRTPGCCAATWSRRGLRVFAASCDRRFRGASPTLEQPQVVESCQHQGVVDAAPSNQFGQLCPRHELDHRLLAALVPHLVHSLAAPGDEAVQAIAE